MSRIMLPGADGRMHPFHMEPPRSPGLIDPAKFNRVAYAAAHVVAAPLATKDPINAPAIDWDATLDFRHHLWTHGFRIAEAMDTSQRGMGFPWAAAKELIARSIAEARTVPGADLASGAGTDHLAPGAAETLEDVIAAYEEQLAYIEGLGGKAIIMASRALAKIARGPEDYIRVYDRLISQSSGKVILHWLGDMFDPDLKGYWGGNSFADTLPTVLSILNAHADKVEGIKISLLDAACEIELREKLPAGVMMFTGDDFNYPDLIKGDGKVISHALLGIFDAIAPVAAEALTALGVDDFDQYDALMAPTVPLSRLIFAAPTQYYKAGIVFLAWLNGYQKHFTMLGGMQSARSIIHYTEIFRLASAANLLRDTDNAVRKMTELLALHGCL